MFGHPLFAAFRGNIWNLLEVPYVSVVKQSYASFTDSFVCFVLNKMEPNHIQWP